MTTIGQDKTLSLRLSSFSVRPLQELLRRKKWEHERNKK